MACLSSARHWNQSRDQRCPGRTERENMSIFGSIMGAIFGHGAQAKTAETTATAAPGAAPGSPSIDCAA